MYEPCATYHLCDSLLWPCAKAGKHLHVHGLVNLFFLVQVFSRLQKLNFCLSHKSTIRCVNKLGSNYVILWKRNIEEMLHMVHSPSRTSPSTPPVFPFTDDSENTTSIPSPHISPSTSPLLVLPPVSPSLTSPCTPPVHSLMIQRIPPGYLHHLTLH